jgi:hypothetical protein
VGDELAITGPLTPTHVRYIKLGESGAWARDSLANGHVSFGYHVVPHDICARGDWDAVRALLSTRKNEGAMTAGVNEVRAFYQMPETCLWVTFADGHLWWTFASADVVWVGDGVDGGPSRFRPTLIPWQNTDLSGRPLRISSLSSKLTKTANFQSTICTIPEEDYLLRRINAQTQPVVAEARDVRSRMMVVATEMIRGLHWRDFETLTDLIFTRSGWRRSTKLGGTMADVDLILEQPTTGELAFVQVKSRANQGIVDDYLERFRASGCDRFFFVCHTASGTLRLPEDRGLHLFEGERLADAAVQNGLFDWLIERSN